MRWQYKWIWLEADPDASIFARDEEKLNSYGSEGWELVSVVAVTDNNIAAVMKKPT